MQNISKIKLFTVFLSVLLIVLLFTYFLLTQLTPRSRTEVPIPTPSTQAGVPSTLPTKSPTLAEPTPFPSDFYAQMESPFDERLFKAETEYELNERPDVTISNETPYDNDIIMIRTEFVYANPGYYKVIVVGKTDNKTVTKTAFEDWMKTIGIPQSSYSKLVVEYL